MSAREKMFISDFKTIKEYKRNRYKEPKIDTSGYIRITKASGLADVKKARIVAIDFELNHAHLHSPSCRLISISFSISPGESKVVDFRNPVSPALRRAVIQILRNPKTTKLVANRPFEEEVARLFLDTIIGGTVIDILTMAHVLDENYQINLENVTNVHTDLRNIKDLAEGKRGNLEEADTQTVINYNGGDTDATLSSFAVMANEMNGERQLKRYYTKFVQPVQDVIAKIAGSGCAIDTRRLAANEQEVERIIAESSTSALNLLPNAVRRKYADNLVLSRNALISDYLFTHRQGLRLTPTMFTEKTRQPATSEKHLKYFSDREFIQHYFRQKKAAKLKGTYINRLWAELQEGDGRKIYPSILMILTVTGRTVILRPEIQTYPKRGEFARYLREVVIADRGWLLGSRDLSQSELRIIGWLAQDPNILQALRDGVDMHTRTAQKVMGIADVTDRARDRAKPVNFGFIYLQTPAGFREYALDEYEVDFTMEESVAFQEAFFARPDGYYRLPVYHQTMIRQAEQLGYVTAPLGRRRRLPSITTGNFVDKNRAKRQAVNFPVQSFSSDLGLLSMKLMQDELDCTPLGSHVKLLWFIHDEVMFQAERKYMTKAHSLLKECMEVRSKEYIWKNFGVEVGYPIESDGKVGINWAEMQKI
jgi:DNA polymerase-1